MKTFISFYIHRYLFRLRVHLHVLRSFFIKNTKFILAYKTIRCESRPNQKNKWYIEEIHEHIPDNQIPLAQPEGIGVQYDILIKKPKWAKY